jgi:hypothetical protein
MLILKKRKNVEIGLDQITGLILIFFVGNTSSPTILGQEYKWCPEGNTMGSMLWNRLHYEGCVIVASSETKNLSKIFGPKLMNEFIHS